MNNKIIIHSNKVVFSDYLKIFKTEFQFRKINGSLSEKISRFTLNRGNAVASLLFNRETQKLLFVKQLRIAAYEKTDPWLLEIVAGMIDNNEDEHYTIKREVLEEVGYQIDSFEKVLTFFTLPGGSSMQVTLFYAEYSDKQKVAVGGGLADENEDIEIIEIEINKVWQMLENAEFIDAKTIIALYWLKNKLSL